MKRISISLIAFLALAAFTFKADRANFSGTWKLNESKSDLGQFARFAPHTIKVDQNNDGITISKTAPSFNGDDVTTTETLTFDGKETETTVFGNSKKKSTVKWSDDAQGMTINYTIELDFNGQTSEIKGTEVWTLGDGGKTLTLKINASSPQGDLASTAVYDKQ